jgi:type IV secretory pathway TraG/TraD family ATPase VirD4
MARRRACHRYQGRHDVEFAGRSDFDCTQDARSAVWDIGKDCQTKQDARELAARFIPKSTDPMWSDAARDIFVACVVSLQSERGPNWSWRDLYERTTLDAEKLLELATQYNPNAVRNLETPESRTTQSILSTFQTHMHVVSTLADAWDANKNDRFSIIDWLRNPTPYRPVILQRDGRYPELSNAWMSGLFSLLSSAVGSPTLAESNTRRIWIFADEFPQLPKMEQFTSLIDLGRSKGIVTVIGAQDIAQLRDTYGRYQGDSWMSMIGTQILTRINLSQAAKDVSAIIGEQEIEKTIKSHTQTPTGSNTTCHTQRERRPVITQSELSTRLGPTKKGIKALVLGVGEDVHELLFPYVNLEQLRSASVQASWTTASPKPTATNSFDAKFHDEKERILSRRDVEDILNLDR